MKKVMIDLETMAVVKNAAILSIGAVVLDMHAEAVLDEFEVNVDLASCYSRGLVKDDGTETFWTQPANSEALAAVTKDAVDLSDALQMFRAWLLRNADKEEIEMWANGTSFDLAILEVAYSATRLPLPWKFYNERDYRTLKNLFRDVPKPEFRGTKHTALDDARFQAEHLIRILRAKVPCL